jgi:hypothetical protein
MPRPGFDPQSLREVWSNCGRAVERSEAVNQRQGVVLIADHIPAVERRSS